MAHARVAASSGLWLALLTAVLPRGAQASNFINIDAGSSGSVASLAITQDADAPSNTISATAGLSAPFAASGAWNSIAISQGGADNKLSGTIRTSATQPAANSFSASYSGGANTHSVSIGSVAAPSSVAQSVSVANTGKAVNTISEVLDSAGALVNGLTVHGTGNTVTNLIAAAAGITLNQTLGDGSGNGTASGNALVNATTGLSGAYDATVRVSGDGVSGGMNNAVANNADGNGARNFNVTLSGSSNTSVFSLLNGGNSTTQQSATLAADSATQAQYAVSSQAGGASSVYTTLAGVIGGVYVQQGADMSGGSVTLTVNGNGYALGTLGALPAGMSTAGLPPNFFGAGGANPGVAVLQSTAAGSSNPLTATVSAFAPGYTASITSSTH